MRVIRGAKEAEATLLGRSLFEERQASPETKRRIREIFGEELTPEQSVARVMEDVRLRGDAALLEWSRRIDGVELGQLEVTAGEFDEAHREVDAELVDALTLAADRVRSFHLAQKHSLSMGVGQNKLGQLVRPLERVGIYVPGGTACYPSTVLMTAIPARVAGVGEVIVATPPGRDGRVPAPTLVAASLAKVGRVFKMGGAQAIAALAFGTETVPRVDKICGPGNIFVMMAKKMVYGLVGLDGLYGPTETVIVVDDSANPTLCAADLLAQAEHDALASAIMITTSPTLAVDVAQEVESQLAKLERRGIAKEALEQRGGIAVLDNMDEVIELVNQYAPEHLCLMVRDAWSYVDRFRHAGGIFVGESSPEALGDYSAGPSHVMPTGGTARFSSPLGVSDFLKVTSVIGLGKEDLKKLGPVAAAIARVEGFTAHARAVERRLHKG